MKQKVVKVEKQAVVKKTTKRGVVKKQPVKFRRVVKFGKEIIAISEGTL